MSKVLTQIRKLLAAAEQRVEQITNMRGGLTDEEKNEYGRIRRRAAYLESMPSRALSPTKKYITRDDRRRSRKAQRAARKLTRQHAH